MKYNNYYPNHKQHRKLKRQVSHLSGFIGMPMWNGRNPSLLEIREYDRRLLERQALGFELKKKKLFKPLFAKFSRAMSKVFNKTVRTGAIMTEKKSLSKKSPECC